jgi:hypothetical protein
VAVGAVRLLAAAFLGTRADLTLISIYVGGAKCNLNKEIEWLWHASNRAAADAAATESAAAVYAMRVVYLPPLGCRANRRKRKTPKETHVALALNAGIITDV